MRLRFVPAALALLMPAMLAAADPPGPARQRELTHMLEHDCGSCHGGRLAGGLGPPLNAEALRERPDESLVATIIHGRPGTPMPPWRPFLSETEARWLVQRIKQGDPNALR